MILLERGLDLLPAYTSSNDTQWLPSDLIVFVHHQEICWSPLRSQCFFSMPYSPFDLLYRNQDFSKRSIDLRLTRIKACHRSDSLLIIEDVAVRRPRSIAHPLPSFCISNVLQKRLQNPSSLLECRFRPRILCFCSLAYGSIDSVRRRRVYVPEKLSIGWTIALNSSGARFLYIIFSHISKVVLTERVP